MGSLNVENLRELNFGYFGAAILTLFRGSILVTFSIQELPNLTKIYFLTCQLVSFLASEILEIDFTENVKGRKLL